MVAGVKERIGNKKEEVIKAIKLLSEYDDNDRPLLKTQSIVDAARNPKSVLHPYFTWDDSEAAERWRNEEARTLIQSLRITFDGDNKPVPVYVSIMNDRVDGGGYRLTSDVITSEELKLQLMDTARMELMAWKERYRILSDIIKLADKWLKEN